MDELIGIPYVVDGRDITGADCWGVVYLYYKMVHNIEVERYDMAGKLTAQDRKALAELIAGEIQDPWIEVSDPMPGDLVLLRVGRDISHVGIWLKGRKIFHSPGPEPSIIERASEAHIKRRIAGFLRHKDLI